MILIITVTNTYFSFVELGAFYAGRFDLGTKVYVTFLINLLQNYFINIFEIMITSP